MSTEILWRLPKQEIFKLYEQRYLALFSEAYDLLNAHKDNPESIKTRPDDILIDNDRNKRRRGGNL
jgi:hypothetical protein